MNPDGSGYSDYKKTLIRYWMDKAGESLESAISEQANHRLAPAVRSTYYACFYALSAVLLARDKIFKKHSGVRGALHKNLIRPGLIDPAWGRFYDRVFDSRQRGDYQPLISFETDEVGEFIELAKGFVNEMSRLLTTEE
jgi:uncharacterized protein (UPF0332 family)